MSNKQSYTPEEVEKLVKVTLSTAAETFLDWLRLETEIVDINTREVLDNAEITLKEGAHSLITDYIYPKLREQGIVFELQGGNK
jgi:hypothetical protein